VLCWLPQVYAVLCAAGLLAAGRVRWSDRDMHRKKQAQISPISREN